MLNLVTLTQKTLVSLFQMFAPSKQTARMLALSVLACQVILLVAALASDVILFADGAKFSFGLSYHDAWAMHWGHVQARYAIYALIIHPAETLSGFFNLTPMATTKLYTLFFFALPILQFAAIIKIAWRNHAVLLIFPVLQYILSLSFAYGFPSESIFAPGFMWICLFLVLTGRTTSVFFMTSFLLLCFTHEVAIFSAIVVAVYALMTVRNGRRDSIFSLLISPVGAGISVVFALFLIVQALGGAEATSSNAIYIIDPRRFLNNPMMWLFAGFACAMIASVRFFPEKAVQSAILFVVAVGAALPIVFAFVFDFDFVSGRYSAARTYIGGFMLLLSLFFVFVVNAKRSGAEAETLAPGKLSGNSYLALPCAGALAFLISSNLIFTHQWSLTLDSLEEFVAAKDVSLGKPDLEFEDVSYQTALGQELLGQSVYAKEFRWSLPFLSFVLSDGDAPARVMLDGSFDYAFQCASLSASDDSKMRFNREAMQEFREKVCVDE